MGRSLALRGPAVVVTVNYRLNVFGWLAHPAFAGENDEGASGNYALYDQIAALRWVQANIARLGGDPQRVLVFGQSAGATNTCALLASPLAAGLFSRALMQSGNCNVLAPATVSSTATNTESALGCEGDADVAGCMRAKPASEVVQVPGAGSSDVTISSKYYPVVDGWALPESPSEALRDGTFNHMPLIAGTTEDEYDNVLGFFVTHPLVTEQDYETAVAQIFGAGAASVLAIYPAAAYASPHAAMAAIFADLAQHCPTRRALRAAAAAQSEPVRRFLFAYDFTQGPLAPFGAAHGHDVAFFWNDFDFINHAPSAAETELSLAMMDRLLRFAATGDPEGEGAAPWPLYDTGDPYLVLDDPIGVGSAFRSAECDFWDAVEAGAGAG